MDIFFLDKKTLGMKELQNDILFDKIPVDQYEELIQFAWEAGLNAALKYQEKLDTTIPSEMLARSGLELLELEQDYTLPGCEVYSEYYSNLKRIVLYKKNILKAVHKLQEKGITEYNYDSIRELFIAHEIFHHLECHHIGITFKKKKIVNFKIGPFKLESGVRALSEIAAHSFTKHLLKI